MGSAISSNTCKVRCGAQDQHETVCSPFREPFIQYQVYSCIHDSFKCTGHASLPWPPNIVLVPTLIKAAVASSIPLRKTVWGTAYLHAQVCTTIGTGNEHNSEILMS